jgi:hypothetical protein
MQGLESFIDGNLYQFIFSGVIIISQLYIANKINPLKKIIEKLESSEARQWEIIDAIRKQLDTLQGEHNTNSCKPGRRK